MEIWISSCWIFNKLDSYANFRISSLSVQPECGATLMKIDFPLGMLVVSLKECAKWNFFKCKIPNYLHKNVNSLINFVKYFSTMSD